METGRATTARDLYALKFVGDPQTSPDGARVPLRTASLGGSVSNEGGRDCPGVGRDPLHRIVATSLATSLAPGLAGRTRVDEVGADRTIRRVAPRHAQSS